MTSNEKYRFKLIKKVIPNNVCGTHTIKYKIKYCMHRYTRMYNRNHNGSCTRDSHSSNFLLCLGQ